MQTPFSCSEPLRHSDHTTTTTTHVLSSYAGPVVEGRSQDPSSGRPAWPAPDQRAATLTASPSGELDPNNM